MATGEDNRFNTACFREQSMAQILLGKTLDTVSAASAAQDCQRIHRQYEGLEGENLVGRNVDKRGLMNIDLNVSPPDDADCELEEAEGSRNGQEIRPPPADAGPDVAGSEVVLFVKREPRFVGIAEEVGVEFEKKTNKIRVDAGAEMVEKNIRKKRWLALLEFAATALVEKEEKNRNSKQRESQESELCGEPWKGMPTRRKISGQRRHSLEAELNGENEVAAAAVVRSSRGRAVAMPNKYRDSILGAVAIAEVELPRRNSGGKSGTVSTKRKTSR